jgi:hypothetical protein
MSSRDEVMYRVFARTMPNHPRNLRGGNRWPAVTNRLFVRQSFGSLDVLYCEGLVCVFDFPRFARLAAVRLPRLSRRGVLESISPESCRALMATRQRTSCKTPAASLAADYTGRLLNRSCSPGDTPLMNAVNDEIPFKIARFTDDAVWES